MDFRKLALKDEKVEVDYENIPEQRTGGAPNLPPGRYIFELPKNLDEAWIVRETGKGQRVALESDRDHPIVIAQVLKSQDEPLIGEVWRGSISNAERNRARKGEPERLVSDMTYLLRDGLGDQEAKPKSNKEFIAALNKHAGARFAADVEWSTYCNKEKTRYIEVEEQAVEDPDGTRGCGTNYYQSSIPRDEQGYYKERFSCKCGASLRAFTGLTRFGKA